MAASMKFVTVTPVYCHPQWFGSRLARLTNETVMGMASMGHKNVVFCPLFDQGEEMSFGAAMREGGGKPNRKRNSVTFYDGNLRVFYREDVTMGPKGLDCGKELPGELETHLKDARLLYLPGPVTPWMMRAANFARSLGVPYVLEPQGSLPTEIYKPGLKSRFVKKQLDPLFSHAASVILPDRDTADTVTKWNWKVGTEVCPLGLMSLRYNSKQQKRLIEGDYLLYLGRIEAGKGINTLIDAFDQIADEYLDHKLVLAGPGAQAFKPLLSQITKKRLTDRIVVPGCVSERKRASLLKYAQLFVRPLQENEPSLSVYEAMACRVPLLLSEGHMVDEIEQSGAGRVVEMNADRWARAIKALIDDDIIRAQMGGAGRKFFKKHLMFQNRIDALVDLLSQVKSARSAA